MMTPTALWSVLQNVHTLREGGNPEPRWFPSSFREGMAAGETTLLNSIGLTNPGIEIAMSELAPKWAEMDANMVMSMSGDSLDQWEEMAGYTRGVDGFAAIELNLSCPNVDDGAMFSHRPHLTEAAVAPRPPSNRNCPLAKLSPNVPDISRNRTRCRRGGSGCPHDLEHRPRLAHRC